MSWPGCPSPMSDGLTDLYRISIHTVREMDARFCVWRQCQDGDEVDVGFFDEHQDAVAYIESVGGVLMDPLPDDVLRFPGRIF